MEKFLFQKCENCFKRVTYYDNKVQIKDDKQNNK